MSCVELLKFYYVEQNHETLDIREKFTSYFFCSVFFTSLSSRELTDDDRLTLEKRNIAATTTTAAAARVQKSLGDILRPQSVCCVRHLFLICTLRAGRK